MKKRPMIVAHRGASHDAPENTLAAFRMGFEQQADAIELDVHLTRDGKIVVLHDGDTKRVGGMDVKVAERTAQELCRINVAAHGRWLEQGRDEKMPTLAEALAVVPADKKVLIEVKCRCGIMDEFEAELGRSGLRAEQTIIITFHGEVARACKERFPDRCVQLLCGCARDESGACASVDELIARAKGLDALALDQRFPIDGAFVDTIKAAGLGCYVWTVDDPERARELAAAGVDGITSNRPGLIRAALQGAVVSG